MEVAMMKRQSDVQGQQVLSLLSGAIDSASAATAAGLQMAASGVNQPVSEGSLGTHINLSV
jgi:hypothetical protein